MMGINLVNEILTKQRSDQQKNKEDGFYTHVNDITKAISRPDVRSSPSGGITFAPFVTLGYFDSG